MIKYDAEINGESSSIEIEGRERQFKATVDGRLYEFDAARPEEGTYQIIIGDSVYRARVSDSLSGTLVIGLRGRDYRVRLTDRKHRRPGLDGRSEGRQSLVSPMPGKVVRILCAIGQDVTAGQGVIVVEAMKMQNEIKAASSGKVIEIRVEEGATVEAGQVLAVIE